MKVRKTFLLVVVGLIIGGFIAAWMGGDAEARRAKRATRAAAQAGTTLSASVSDPRPFCEVCDWTVEKSVDPTNVTIKEGECDTVTYTITATRTCTPQNGLTGTICVTNGGAVPTIGLSITAVVQVQRGDGQGFVPWSPFTVDTTPKPVLAPGESFCYPYTAIFLLDPTAKSYRVRTSVTILNHSGWLPGGRNCPGPAPCPFGPRPASLSFEWFCGPPIDACASLDDVQVCPDGFTCTPAIASPDFPVEICDSGPNIISFQEEICNNTQECCQDFEKPNTVTLTELDSREERVATATVAISTGPCYIITCDRTEVTVSGIDCSTGGTAVPCDDCAGLEVKATILFTDPPGCATFIGGGTTLTKTVGPDCTVSFADELSITPGCAVSVGYELLGKKDCSGGVPGTDCRFTPPIPPGGCTLTQGFWKTHPDAWTGVSLTLGTVLYNQAQLLSILGQPVAGNGLISLAHQLIAAKLNVLNGAACSNATTAINAADALIDGLVVPPIGGGFLDPSVTDALTTALDDYNNGLMADCPPHCD